MRSLKKGRARRAKAKAARTTNVYQIRSEFSHLAIEGAQFFIVGDFRPQTPEEMQEAMSYFREKPPMFHGVIFHYGEKP